MTGASSSCAYTPGIPASTEPFRNRWLSLTNTAWITTSHRVYPLSLSSSGLAVTVTIPEKVQTIILTRGEGRTPMPEKEKLHLLARSQSTMCIFLSASIVDQVQSELMQHYPPTTPVAACYHLTWKDERIYRGELQDLAKIVKENNLTLTTMIVVGDAIDNRQGLSKLYSHQFKHLFRN